MDLSLICHRRSPVPMMITLFGLKFGTLRRASTSTSVSQEYVYVNSIAMMTHSHCIQDQQCICFLLCTRNVHHKEKTPLGVRVVIGTLHN